MLYHMNVRLVAVTFFFLIMDEMRLINLSHKLFRESIVLREDRPRGTMVFSYFPGMCAF